MRFLTLTSLSLLLLATAAHAPALAEDNVIKVINDDGTVSVINIGPNAGEPVTMEAKEPPKEAKDKAGKSPATEEAAQEGAPVQEDKPAKKAKAKKDKAAKETKAEKKPVKEVKPVPPKPVSNAYKPVVPPGHELSREEAMAIAIENTSMIARGLDAFPRTLDGKLVWVVVFKTDQGERDILVDAKTGEIVRVKN